MKKICLTSLLILILTLTACSSTANANSTGSSQESPSLSTTAQLVVGTLKLDGTGQSVTAAQANDLLVMWQVYQDLINSDTAAQEEIDGLVEQIQETMTTDQMSAIKAMGLTQQDIFAVMQEQGGDFVQAQRSDSETFSFSPNSGGGPGGGGPPDGGMAGGAPPDGGMGGDMGAMGGAGPGTSTDQSQSTGTGSGAGRSAGSAGVPTALVDALIQYLQQIASA